MFFSRKKSKPRVVQEEPPVWTKLVHNNSFDIKFGIFISKGDCMNLRLSVLAQQSSCNAENFSLCAKNAKGEQISYREEFIGFGSNSNDENIQELLFSLFIHYPERDMMIELKDRTDEHVIHQKVITRHELVQQRAASDKILFWWVPENDPFETDFYLNNCRASAADLIFQRQYCFDVKPKFSIVVPLYHTPINFLNEMIDSIKEQTYTNWELLLVRAKDESSELANAVKSAVQSDERVREVLIEKNEGISLNTAQGIEETTGDFVCFLDHDDTIEPNCLFEYARRINEKPQTDLLYCDEDLLEPTGKLDKPACKPEFSEIFMRSNNYVCHMLTIRRSLLLQLEFNNSLYDGAQDHHLTLQAAEKTENIELVPKILYHWRVCETSTAGNEGSDKKPFATDAGIRAISKHLERRGIKGKVLPHHTFNFYTHVIYEIPEPKPQVSIIALMDDQIAYKAEDLVSSIRANTTYENYEIVIASTRDLPFQEKEVKVCNVGDSLNKAQKLNAARRSASGKILIFITDCVEIVTPSFVDELVGIASLDSVGAVCGKALYPDETIKHAGIYLGEMPYRLFSNLPNRGLSYHGYLETSKEVSALSVDFMTIKANQFDELEGFDERFPSFCDVDLCLKLRKINKHIVYNPTSEIISLETSQSCFDYTSNLRAEGHIEWSNLQAKWGDFLTHDPHVFKPASKDWRGGYLYPLLV